MPTSPAPAKGGAPASGAAVRSAAARVRSAVTTRSGAGSQRPAAVTTTARASEVINVEETPQAATPVTSRAQQTGPVMPVRSTLALLAGAAAPQAVEEGGEIIPAAFQPVPDEPVPDAPMADAPRTVVQARRFEPEALVGVRRVLGIPGCGGRGLSRLPTEHRAPTEGRVVRSSRTRRGPKKTAHQRRFAASRPSGHHPLLNPWDLTPLDIRSTQAGQERAIFRTRGFLVSHLDFQMYRMLSIHNVSLVPTVFPLAPLWWPADWGHIPITLPWEVSLHRSLLVSADPEEAVWQEVYQKFLEQLAGGWDLYYSQTEDPEKLEALPATLARAIIDAGGFSFCAGSVSSASYKKFLQLHSMSEGSVADQRTAKNTAWARINALRKERKAQDEASTGAAVCRCNEKISRAVRRLGIEAQILEATGEETPLDVSGDVEKLAALSSAVLTFALSTDQMVSRVDSLLSSSERNYYNRQLEEAQGILRGAKNLAEFLPDRISANLSRLSTSRPTRSVCRD